MQYKEQFISRVIYLFRRMIYKFKRIPNKIKKIWVGRKEYVSKEYWNGKSSKADVNAEAKQSKVSMQKNFETVEKVSRNPKLAIYTVVFGNYDKIYEPLFKSKYCDYFIITDLEIPEKSAWKKIMPKEVPEGFEDWNPAIKNRYYKMHPQYVFDDYEYSLYVDGNLRPIADLYPFVLKLQRKNSIIGMFKHPCFNCFYESAEHLKNINLVDKQKMDLQIDKYKSEGFPVKYGFFECGCLLRKHNDPKCKTIMEDWWHEYVNYVKRDQQSITYALWKNGLAFSDVCIFGSNIRNDLRFKLYVHKENHKKIIQEIKI